METRFRAGINIYAANEGFAVKGYQTVYKFKKDT